VIWCRVRIKSLAITLTAPYTLPKSHSSKPGHPRNRRLCTTKKICQPSMMLYSYGLEWLIWGRTPPELLVQLDSLRKAHHLSLFCGLFNLCNKLLLLSLKTLSFSLNFSDGLVKHSFILSQKLCTRNPQSTEDSLQQTEVNPSKSHMGGFSMGTA